MAYDIFISYSKNDISIASLLSEIIRELGLRCYVDMDELQESGEVQSAILNSEYVIYIYMGKIVRSLFGKDVNWI